MCESDNHDFIVAGVGGGHLVLVCRRCGAEREHDVADDFKLSDWKMTIEEKI